MIQNAGGGYGFCGQGCGGHNGETDPHFDCGGVNSRKIEQKNDDKFIQGSRELKGRKVNYKSNPQGCFTEFSLTIKSDFAFVLGGELCVWLEEKSYPVLLAALEFSGDEKRGYEWSKPC